MSWLITDLMFASSSIFAFVKGWNMSECCVTKGQEGTWPHIYIVHVMHGKYVKKKLLLKGHT